MQYVIKITVYLIGGQKKPAQGVDINITKADSASKRGPSPFLKKTIFSRKLKP